MQKGNANISATVSSEVATIFRTRRVNEIRQIEARVREDAEKKGAELVNMLGCRYQELLSAVDILADLEKLGQRIGGQLPWKQQQQLKLEAITADSSNTNPDLTDLHLHTQNNNDTTGIHLSDTSALPSNLNIIRQLSIGAKQLKTSLLSKAERHSEQVRLRSSSIDQDRVKQSRAAYTVASNLKFLVDTPENLYACLDNDDLLTNQAQTAEQVTWSSATAQPQPPSPTQPQPPSPTQPQQQHTTSSAILILQQEKKYYGKLYDAVVRYHGAEKARANLEADKNAQMGSSFVDSQWKAVVSFRNPIIEKALKYILQPSRSISASSARLYAGAMAAWVTMNSHAAVYDPSRAKTIQDIPQNILALFLDGRLKYMETVFQMASSSFSSLTYDKNVVSSALQTTIHILKDSVYLVYAIFLTKESRTPDCSLNHLLAQCMSKELLDKITVLDPEDYVQPITTVWIDKVRGLLNDLGARLVKSVSSANDVEDLFLSVCDSFEAGTDESFFKTISLVDVKDPWNFVSKSVLIMDKAAIQTIFTSILQQRAQDIARELVQSSVSTMKLSVEEAWTDFISSDDVPKNRNTSDVWTRTITPSELLYHHSPTNTSKDGPKLPTTTGAHMQITTKPTELVKKWATLLQDAMGDLTVISKRIPEVASVFRDNITKLSPELIQCLEEKLNNIHSYHQEMLAQKIEFIGQFMSCLYHDQALYQAFCFGINRHSLDNPTTTFRGTSTVTSASPEYSKMANVIISISAKAFDLWAKCIVTDAIKEFQVYFDRGMFRHKYGWETTNEAENITYPACLSPGAFKCIMKVSKEITNAGGFTLPHYVKYSVSVNLVSLVGDIYKANAEKLQSVEYNKDVETEVLQMIFDLEFLKYLVPNSLNDLVSVVTPEEVKSNLQKVQSDIQAFVDPIDWAVCSRYLMKEVGLYFSRSHTLMGTLVGPYIQPPAKSVNYSSTSKSSSLLPLVKGTTRFQYLPAPTPSIYSARSSILSARTTISTIEADVKSEESRKEATESGVVENLTSRFSSMFSFGRG